MMNQVPISVRMDSTVKWRVDQEVMLGDYNRNRIINRGADMYVDLLDARRQYRAHPNQDVRKKILKGFLLRWFPEADI